MPALPKKSKISFKRDFKKGREQIEKLPFKRLLVISIALSLLTLLVVFLLLGQLPPQVPLYYGLAKGEGQLSAPSGLLIPSFVSLSVIFINTLTSSFFENDFLRRVLIGAGFAVTLLTTITTIRILLLIS